MASILNPPVEGDASFPLFSQDGLGLGVGGWGFGCRVSGIGFRVFVVVQSSSCCLAEGAQRDSGQP